MEFPDNICQGSAITMDCHNYNTKTTERKKGQHLRMEDRGAIKALRQQGLGIRAIARQVGCAPSTVTNELRRGTPTRKSTRGRRRATLQSWEKQSMRPTEQPATGSRKRSNAVISSAGWSSRCENTSGLWMPAAAMPRCTLCSIHQRWSARAPSTAWSGPDAFVSGQPSCPRH